MDEMNGEYGSVMWGQVTRQESSIGWNRRRMVGESG